MPLKLQKNKIANKKIVVKGARVHNLKNIDVEIPRNQLVVITGLSGSGKSSLAFDTLYAEGQRRYVESLSSYARQFMGKLDKPDVESISGISPAIAIEQKVTVRNSRSTVGTTTEIYDYLKLLYARIGKTYSPKSGDVVQRDTPKSVLDYIMSHPDGTRIMLLSPIVFKKDRTKKQQLELLMQQGYSRISVDKKLYRIDEVSDSIIGKAKKTGLLIDRFSVKKADDENTARITDSIEMAFYESGGDCVVEVHGDEVKEKHFSNRFELDGIVFEEPTEHFFSYNNPVGACKVCGGFGNVIGIDEDLVIPLKNLSVYDNAIAPWKGEKMGEWKNELIYSASKFDFPVHRPIRDLTAKEKELLWTGNKHFKGLNDFFKHVEEQSYKIQYRVMLSRYRGRTKCRSCNGTRLRKDAGYVKINQRSITDLLQLPISQLGVFFDSIELSDYEKKVSERILKEISNRLQYLQDVGLGYLTLNRLSNSLSGGETQRINLANSLGSSLVGSTYILDEPSIGLHSRDTERLIKVLKSLRDLGNTVIVVEHDEDIMRASDQIIDMGLYAGTEGGEVIFQGSYSQILENDKSITGQHLSREASIEIPENRRNSKEYIELIGVKENNLKGFDIKFPLDVFTVVTGVSGSGKTSLVKNILYPAVAKSLELHSNATGEFTELKTNKKVKAIEFINQNPIGKSSRSNPVTYLKAFDEIRGIFSEQKQAKMMGYKPSTFSFNVEGGRCEMCQGEGVMKVEMQFMADIHLTCDTCNGNRFKKEVLEVTYREKNIAEVLKMTVDDALTFFSEEKERTYNKRLINKLIALKDVGLGYIQLGQSSTTLSGGEAQRIKLASFLMKGESEKHTLFIFDEPTTGLHAYDINKLLISFNALIALGHSLIVIEHNLDVVKSADWVIDLGPDGGDKGGNLVFEGTPEELANCKESYTGKYLKEIIY